MARPTAQCPIRDGEPCSLCVPGVDGPHECGLVWLVMNDPEMREMWNEHRQAKRAARQTATPTGFTPDASAPTGEGPAKPADPQD